MRPSIFISHAGEDKERVARPLAISLKRRGFDVWYDEFVLRVGDSLLASIDRGLRECDFGIVILSESFFSKKWPKLELAGLVARESDESPVILPIWHELTVGEVAAHSPVLADRLAASTSEDMNSLVDRIVTAVRSHGGLGKQLLDAEFLVTYSVSGAFLFDLTKEVLRRQHQHLSGDADGRLTLHLYEDGSGLDEHESGFAVTDQIVRRVKSGDLYAILSEQPYMPGGYSVRHIEFETEILIYDNVKNGREGQPIDLRDVPLVYFTAVVDQHFVNSDEIVQFITALTRFENTLHSDPLDLFWSHDSPGRLAVRRLMEAGRIGETQELIQADYRGGFALGTAIVSELRAPPPDESGSRVLKLLASDHSPLNDYWKKKLADRLRRFEGHP
jgi:TIR domain